MYSMYSRPALVPVNMRCSEKKLDRFHTKLDGCHTILDRFHTKLDGCHTVLDKKHTIIRQMFYLSKLDRFYTTCLVK